MFSYELRVGGLMCLFSDQLDEESAKGNRNNDCGHNHFYLVVNYEGEEL